MAPPLGASFRCSPGITEMIGKILKALFLGVVLIAVVVVIKTMLFVPPTLEPRQSVSYVIDEQSIVRHMSEAITFQTISHGDDSNTPREPFEDFIAWLAETYPLVHSQLSNERIAQYSLLYKWPGSDTGSKPILLTAHYDVVPVPQSSADQWQHQPFAGEVEDGVVWGRGALDDKSAVIALMEAVTLLLESGQEPRQDVYIAIGHDEEVGGYEGAAAIVSTLKQRGIQFEWSLDEGSFVLDGIIPGLDVPLAGINLAEKGFLTIEIIARSEGGHSSMPPHDMAIYMLTEVLNDLHETPFALHMDSGPSIEMYLAIARYMPFKKRMVFANRWLFGPLLESALTKNPIAAAMLHTTIAPTMLNAGIKANVLAPEARATVNLRIHPQDDVVEVVASLRRTIERDGVTIDILNKAPASPISRAGSAGFARLANVARMTFGDVIVAPGLTIAGTDSKHYGEVSDDSYRFNPMVIDSADLATFHGVNERISIDNLVKATSFYAALIMEAGH